MTCDICMTMFRLARRSLSSNLTAIPPATGWMVVLLVVGTAQAGQESSLYSVERPLAQSQQVYVVVDLKDRVVWIKARGIPVRKFAINAVTWVGDPRGELSVFAVESKHPFIEPLPTIPSSPDRQETQGLQKPLMVSDMPTQFEIGIQGGGAFLVQSIRTASMFQATWDWLRSWMNRIFFHLAVWIQSLSGEEWSQLVLEMTPPAAQGLYWAVAPSTRIILHPGS